MMTPTKRRRAGTRASAGSRLVAQALGRLGVVVLVCFHVWLLWTHAATGKLLEPDVAVRWGLAGLLALALWTLRRLGLPLFTGRRAVVLWLLVILIHCHAVWTGDASQVVLAVPQGVVDLIPESAQMAAALGALLFVAWLALQYDASHLRPRITDLPALVSGLPAAAGTLLFSPRPPPVC